MNDARIITGRCEKAGSGQYGPWYLISLRVVKKDGSAFDKRVMCSGNEAVAEGEVVTVVGSPRTKVTERDGKHYADESMSFCTVVARHEERGESKPAASKPDAFDTETFADSIPFHHLPYDSLDTTRCGHRRW